MDILFFAFDDLTLQDLVGAHEVLWRAPGVRASVCGVGDNRVVSEGGITLECDAIFGEGTACDMFVVPGGAGINRLIADEVFLKRLRALGKGAKYVTSVCTGALVLAAAGLLDGYRATTHWRYRDLLTLGGAIPDEARVVRDRNRITGGGVTAGVDFGLATVRELWGTDVAHSIALSIEYDPETPSGAGAPYQGGSNVIEKMMAESQTNHDERHALLSARAKCEIR